MTDTNVRYIHDGREEILDDVNQAVDLVKKYKKQWRRRRKLVRLLPIVIPFVFIAIVLIKILQVSNGSVDTALAVAGLSGPTQIIEGIAVLGLPMFAWILFELLRIAEDDLIFPGISRSWFWIGFFVLVTVLSVYLPWYMTVFVLLAVVVSVVFRNWDWLGKWLRKWKGEIQEGKWSFPRDDLNDIKLRKLRNDYHDLETVDSAIALTDQDLRRRQDFTRAWNSRVSKINSVKRRPADLSIMAIFILALVSLISQAETSTPWMPAENIQTPTGQIVGYSLTTDSAWTTILENSPRIVETVKTSSIRAISICQIPGSILEYPTIYQLVNLASKRPPYPNCPSVP